jgi:hypothetical protein
MAVQAHSIQFCAIPQVRVEAAKRRSGLEGLWKDRHLRKVAQLNLVHLNEPMVVLFAAKQKVVWYEGFTGHGCNSSFQDAEG